MNSEENVIEGKAYDPLNTEEAKSAAEDSQKGKAPSGSLNKAWKQVENIGQTLGEALQGRGNVVMVRVNDDTLEHLDMLVESELCKSRSEAAALLIGEGINANQALFERIREITDQIAGLRTQLRAAVQAEGLETPDTTE